MLKLIQEAEKGGIVLQNVNTNTMYRNHIYKIGVRRIKLLKCSTQKSVFRNNKAKYLQKKKLLLYNKEKQQFAYAVSTEMLKLKVLSILKELRMNQANLKANRESVVRFLERNGLSIKGKQPFMSVIFICL